MELVKPSPSTVSRPRDYRLKDTATPPSTDYRLQSARAGGGLPVCLVGVWSAYTAVSSSFLLLSVKRLPDLSHHISSHRTDTSRKSEQKCSLPRDLAVLSK